MVEQELTFKDILGGAAGLMFQMGGIDRLAQSVQLAIIMIGSNPF